jgi:ribonuclease Z
VLNVHERFFLIDCGEGTQMQLRKFRFKLGKINHIFISHLHGDHTLGLFGLISTLVLLDRKSKLTIYGPPLLEKIIEDHLEAFEIDLPFPLEYVPLNCGISTMIYEDDRLTVETIPLKHRIPTCGFLFKEKPRQKNILKEKIREFEIPIRERQKIKEGADLTLDSGEVIPNELLTIDPNPPRSFAYCTDTLYNERIIPIVRGVNLLYHEATFMQDMADQAQDNFHSTAHQAAQIAKKAEVGKLILGHFSSRYKDLDPLLQEARDVFNNSFLAEDGSVFHIE